MGISKFWLRGSAVATAAMMAVGLTSLAQGQTIRTYDVNKTTATVVADGVISAGEWDAASTDGSGAWGELRIAADDPGWADTEGNRFRMQYDDNNLYILWESDRTEWFTENTGAGNNPDISFGEENLNMYIDPRADGELANNVPDNEVDGYQLAFNQYTNSAGGALISTQADRQGVGFYTEAHVDSPFGNQGQWGVPSTLVDGNGIGEGSGITVAQLNTTGAGGGGLAEIVIPFDSLNALAEIDDGLGNEPPTFKTTGLNQAAIGAPSNGDTWLFNMSAINRGGDPNFLPIWNWHNGGSFAVHGGVGHGEITFVDPSVGGGPDLNGDGFVDGLDLGILLGNFNQSGIPESGGELDGVDPVDGLDLGILLGAWNPPVAEVSSVPEPASLALLALAGVAAMSTRRSRS